MKYLVKMSKGVYIIPGSKTMFEEVHPYCPNLFFECNCGQILFYLAPVKDTYELVCFGCGSTKEWNVP